MSETKPDPIAAAIGELKTQMEEVRSQVLGPGCDWHLVLTVAAFSKAFDFAASTFSTTTDEVEPFWMVATLRGVVEEIIVLSALATLPREDRNELLELWQRVTVSEGLEKQAAFFASPERLQSVLTPDSNSATELALNRQRMKEIWMDHGFDPGPKGQGNVRSMAEKGQMLELYDFFYNLASRLVHFNPAVLLRMGWGDIEEDRISTTFRASNFGQYYADIATGYSSFLLAEFIERLGATLELGSDFDELASAIRKELSTLRLPELITFEEMNMKPPGPLLRVMEVVMRSDPTLR